MTIQSHLGLCIMRSKRTRENQLVKLNTIYTMACRLYENAKRLENQKYIAHQLALLYHCLSNQGNSFSRFTKEVESEFDSISRSVNTMFRIEPPQISW
ncbi:hypothetical protein BDF20DRAFT_707286 [Mycotypha africana]|uniref:uncharacterized protein n=1 Tax=Mycotypha africana TaxID=64632 RepID=UPI0023009CD9|nr:uncharacterized protein BDF20DRAFT_707286 [Mycotypha africana]KAI8971914.1 hypothetical protein BDF20DRAFT_707286 [Mycotypha africana]